MFINKKTTTQATTKTLSYRHDGEKESEVRKMKILPLRIENGRLILDGVRLTGVEGYTIKISSELPKGNAELNLKIIVSFPENTQEQNPLRD